MKKILMLFLMVVAGLPNGFAQQSKFTCSFTNAAGMRWANGAWRTTSFQVDAKTFNINVEGGNIDIKSVAQHFGGWGGMNASCSPIDSINSESRHIRCVMTAVSSKMLIFNPATKKGMLVTPDGVLLPDEWSRKDDIGIEAFKCD